MNPVGFPRLCMNRPMFGNSDAFLYTLDNPHVRDRVIQLYPPVNPYIKTSFEYILMYEMVGCFINKYFNYADHTNVR